MTTTPPLTCGNILSHDKTPYAAGRNPLSHLVPNFVPSPHRPLTCGNTEKRGVGQKRLVPALNDLRPGTQNRRSKHIRPHRDHACPTLSHIRGTSPDLHKCACPKTCPTQKPLQTRCPSAPYYVGTAALGRAAADPRHVGRQPTAATPPHDICGDDQ